MAPVDPDLSNSNFKPLAVHYAQTTLIGILIAIISATISKAHRTLPPSQHTRSQDGVHKSRSMLFAGLAAISAAILSYLALAARYDSYITWAQQVDVAVPNTLWDGWYAQGENGMRLQLGRWWSDVDFTKQVDEAVVDSSAALWWTQQQLMGTLVWSIYVGIEGQRRNMSSIVIAAFVLLARLSGLSVAQNLFNIAIIFTAVPLPQSSKKDPLWTPHPLIYLVSGGAALLMAGSIPYTRTGQSAIAIYRMVYYAAPLMLALMPSVVPKRLGMQHSNFHTLRTSQTKIFYVLGGLSLFFHLKQGLISILDNTPTAHKQRHNYVWNMHKDVEVTLFSQTHVAIGRVLEMLNSDPVVGVIAWDVLLSALTACVWAFDRSTNLDGILKCSIFPWHSSASEKEAPQINGREVSEAPNDTIEVKPRRRPGRPKKNTPAANASAIDENANLRRSTRHRRTTSQMTEQTDPDYVPSAAAKAQVDGNMHEDDHNGEDLVGDSESAALGWGLFVLGGLGLQQAGVLGSECCA
ncbi:hypothetical protein K402DRAFT_386343 [Aulographum hederae CBS 113979]|uniref:Uncharacterized protein n=1 Tax=Aulographum hederae CBS 113979 TaxID=1176131 RepID=A0A6G1GKN4_9PEZI|nr:hypothetical protein K402DRAFT_386343 [Aulographum hederae CBS 113979]